MPYKRVSLTTEATSMMQRSIFSFDEITSFSFEYTKNGVNIKFGNLNEEQFSIILNQPQIVKKLTEPKTASFFKKDAEEQYQKNLQTIDKLKTNGSNLEIVSLKRKPQAKATSNRQLTEAQVAAIRAEFNELHNVKGIKKAEVSRIIAEKYPCGPKNIMAVHYGYSHAAKS